MSVGHALGGLLAALVLMLVMMGQALLDGATVWIVARVFWPDSVSLFDAFGIGILTGLLSARIRLGLTHDKNVTMSDYVTAGIVVSGAAVLAALVASGIVGS